MLNGLEGIVLGICPTKLLFSGYRSEGTFDAPLNLQKMAYDSWLIEARQLVS